MLDEPTSALDVNTIYNLLSILNEIKRDKIIIIITHDNFCSSIEHDELNFE